MFAVGNADELLYYFGDNSDKGSNAAGTTPQRMQSNRFCNSRFQ